MKTSVIKVSVIITLLHISMNTSGQVEKILFQEDFENSSIREMTHKWNDTKNTQNMFFSEDIPPASRGKHSLAMTYSPEKNSGGHLYKMLPAGYDSLFARFYVKFNSAHSKVHHFVHMGGYDPPTQWPQGGAGIRPKGKKRFTTGIEPIGDRWSWDFYTYWMHMRGCANPGYYWGNTFHPNPPAHIKREEWICVEFMMKINDPVDSFNGEQAFWIDGKKIIHLGDGFPNGYWVWDKFYPHIDSLAFEGFQWRSNEKLKLNFFWLLYYMTDGIPNKTDTVYFDDIIISTSYIGPLEQ